MEEISRKEAIAQGHKVYFTGVPCSNSHIAPRRVSNYSCLECSRKHAQEFLARRPDYFREYRLQNQETMTSYEREYYRTRKERADAG